MADGINEAGINNAIADAKRLSQEQSTARAGSAAYPFPQYTARPGDAARNLLLSLTSGINAARPAIQSGDAFSAAAAGFAGAAQAPTVEMIEASKQALLAQQRMQQIEAQSLDEVSPGMVSALAELGIDASGIPLGAISKLGPILNEVSQSRAQKFQVLNALLEREEKRRQQGLQTEEGLRKEFSGLSKDFRTIRDAYTKIQASGKNPSQAGDISLIYGYMKLLDPGSTVREGEFATAQNAGNIPQRVLSQYNALLSSNGRLDASIRADFLNRADEIYQSQSRINDKLKTQFEGLAKSAGVSSENVVLDDSAPAARPSAWTMEKEKRLEELRKKQAEESK